jgi:hypothetical protein
LQTDPSAEPKVVDEIANLTLSGSTSSTILRLALPPEKNRELYRAVFRKMLETPNAKNLIVAEMLVAFDRVEEVVGRDQRPSLFRALDNMDTASELKGEKWRTIQPSFLDAAKDAKSKQVSLVVGTIQSGLSALSQEQWADVLNTEGNELALLFKLMKLKELRSLGPMFFDAIRSYGQRMVDGIIHPSKFLSEWHELPHQLSHAQRSPFYKSLRDQLLSKAPKPEIIVRVFRAFGEAFGANGDFADRRGDVIRAIIEPLMADSHENSLNCLEEYGGAFKQTVRRASKEDRQFLTDRLSALFSSAEEPRKSKLKDLGLVLEIELNDIPKIDDAEEGSKPADGT